MRCACIDVGSNTTRMLVAERASAGFRAVHNTRAFTLIGRSLAEAGRIPSRKIDEVASVVAEQAGLARALGARRVRVVATAAIRASANPDALASAVGERANLGLEVLGGEEEARLVFAGATHVAGIQGSVAVVDVGGGSTEIAVGEAPGQVMHARSLPIGSSLLAERHITDDPPTAQELAALRAEVTGVLDAVEIGVAGPALAVGGSASSLAHLAGEILGRPELRKALDALCREPAADVAERFGLDPRRVRLLPAGLVVLDELSARLERPFRICKGGLREGVVLEMIGELD